MLKAIFRWYEKDHEISHSILGNYHSKARFENVSGLSLTDPGKSDFSEESLLETAQVISKESRCQGHTGVGASKAALSHTPSCDDGNVLYVYCPLLEPLATSSY